MLGRCRQRRSIHRAVRNNTHNHAAQCRAARGDVYCVEGGALSSVLGQQLSTKLRRMVPYTRAMQQLFGILTILTAGAMVFQYDGLIIRPVVCTPVRVSRPVVACSSACSASARTVRSRVSTLQRPGRDLKACHPLSAAPEIFPSCAQNRLASRPDASYGLRWDR